MGCEVVASARAAVSWLLVVSACSQLTRGAWVEPDAGVTGDSGLDAALEVAVEVTTDLPEVLAETPAELPDDSAEAGPDPATDPRPDDAAALDVAGDDGGSEGPCGEFGICCQDDQDCRGKGLGEEACRPAVCDDGGCALQENEPGWGCDDEDPCTVDETCVGEPGELACVGVPACDDGDPDTVDTCDAEGKCTFTPISAGDEPPEAAPDIPPEASPDALP